MKIIAYHFVDLFFPVVFSVSATEGLQGQNRLYTTVAPLSSVPPPAVVSASMPSAPPIVQGPYVAAPLVNYPPPPGPPSHFQMAGHVPVQFAAPPPPPPPPPPQVSYKVYYYQYIVPFGYNKRVHLPLLCQVADAPFNPGLAILPGPDFPTQGFSQSGQ